MLGRDPLQLLLIVPGLLAAITFHEYAHAAVATSLGDPTPRATGRLTLNPIKHIDIIGLLLLVTAGFGWAKPVEINPRYFQDQRRGMLLVSAAGPGMNFFLALLSLMLLKLFLLKTTSIFGQILLGIMQFNVILGVFNLLPIPPLDGSKLLAAAVGGSAARLMSQLQQYGWMVLLLLLWTGIIGRILRPVMQVVISLLDSFSSILIPM